MSMTSPTQKAPDRDVADETLLSAVPVARPGPGYVDPILADIGKLAEIVTKVQAINAPLEDLYVKKIAPPFLQFHNDAQRARMFIWNLRDDFQAQWAEQAAFVRGQQAAAAEAIGPNGYATAADRTNAIAQKQATFFRDGEKKVRDAVMSKATPEAETIGTAIGKSARACATALAWGFDHFESPFAVRTTPTLDAVSRQSALELAWQRRPAGDCLRDLKHVWDTEAEGSIAIEIANEAARTVFVARYAMTPGEVAKAIGVDVKVRAGVVDKDKDAAFDGIRALKRYRETRMPNALKLARDEAMPLVVSIHEQLCGRHARYIPRGRTDYLDNSASYTAPFASVLTEWLGRYLPPSPFALPGWSPRITGAPYREGAGSR